MVTHFLSLIYWMVTAVQPRVKEEPRDWQNLFVILRFFFIYFTIIAEMPISGNLKSGDPLFFPIPPPPPPNSKLGMA